MLSVLLSLVLFSILIGDQIDSRAFVIIGSFFVIIHFILLKFFGYHQKQVEVLINPKTIDEENKELFKEAIPLTKREKFGYVGEAILLILIAYIILTVLSLFLELSSIQTGQLMAVFMVIPHIYLCMQLLYVYKEEWFLKLKYHPMSNMGYWLSFVFAMLAFNTTFNPFTYYGFNQIRIYLLPILLLISLTSFYLQKQHDQKRG